MTLFFFFCAILLLQGLAIVLVCALETYAPAHAFSPRRWRNLGIGALMIASTVFGPALLGPLTTLAVNAAGGGLIALPHTGWGILIGAAIYLIAMDFGEYLFHRAQHAIPWMWAMHSLHHSDPDFGAPTTVRHFWLDPILKALTIWLAVGVLFKASPLLVGIYGVIGYYNFLAHANLRLDFGRASWIWNSPAYHRLHHSSRTEHFDINFAALLPVFDLLSGSYKRPGKDEYPETGLDTGAHPRSLFQAIIWPWCGAPVNGAVDAPFEPASARQV